MAEGDYQRSVFVNCPFDEDYQPLHNAIIFTIIYLGFEPQLASMVQDSGQTRIDKIATMIKKSRYGIHDISRLKSSKADEYARLNMPLELGMDLACRKYVRNRKDKAMLIMAEQRYEYQIAMSDLAGSDIVPHGGLIGRVITAVRNWLENHAPTSAMGAKGIEGHFVEFQGDLFERLEKRKFSIDEMVNFPVGELVKEMRQWLKKNLPKRG